MSFNPNDTQILLASEEEEETPPDPSDVTAGRIGGNLSQRSKLKGYDCDFLILNERYLSVHATRKGAGNKTRETKYSINLAYLDPTPKRYVKRDWKWLKIGGALGLVAAGLVGLAFSGLGVSEWQYYWPGVILVGVAGAISLMLFYLRLDDKVVFHARYSRTPLVQVLARNPSKAASSGFVKELKGAIDKSASDLGADSDRALKGELKEHRRLRDEGILPDGVYEKVKKRIMLRYS